MKKFVAYFINNSLIANLVSIALIISGLMFVFSANREAFPKVDFGWVMVETPYPGATAADVEKLISKPIEDELREVTGGVKSISSSSVENYSVVAIEIEADVDNKDKLIQDIKDAVDKVRDLPEDAEDPEVTELNTSEFPVLRVSLITKGGIDSYQDELEMQRYLKILKDRLITVDGAAQIDDAGYREKEMHVEVDIEKLDRYHLGLNEITTALSNKNINFPGGVAKENNEDVMIRTIGEFQTAEEIEDVVIRANDIGELVRIGDVARVQNTFEEAEVINKLNGKKSMTLTIMIKENYDIITLVDDVKEIIEDYETNLPDTYEVVLTDDFSKYVQRRLDVLKGNGLVGIILVVLSLFVALGWRISLVTSIGLPIAFAGTFWMMGIYDVSINLISMFALIMVLGMLVDDAIIVSENIYRHLEHGEKLKNAVITGTAEVIFPVAGTILTTIAAFAPMLFIGGIMGKFMWALPAVVSIALTMSWLESMLILPSHIYDMERKSEQWKQSLLRRFGFLPFAKKKDQGFKEQKQSLEVTRPKKMDEVRHSRFRIRRRYIRVLAVVLRHKIKFLVAISLVLILTIGFAVKFVKFDLFPGGGIETFAILAEAPAGTSLESMEKKIAKIEAAIEELPDEYVESYISRTGILQETEMDPDTKTGSKYGSVIVNLSSFHKRRKLDDDADAQAVMDRLRDMTADVRQSDFAKVTFKMVEDGPPTGAAVNVNIRGEDIDTLKEIADEYKAYLETIDGVENIKDSFEEEKKELRIYVDQAMAVRTGISVLDVASTIRTYYEGSVATEIKKSEEEIEVRVILPEGDRDDLGQLNDIKIANRQGALIPINLVASFERTQAISSISRKEWRRNLVVTADISEDAQEISSVKVNMMMQEKFAEIEQRYPGYLVNYEGEFEDTQDSIKSLGKSYIIAILAIYIILVALFSNLRQPLVVLSIIPFTLLGVVWSYYFHGIPLSFMAMMGIVGLAGVVVNDSIVYVDFINKARQRGKDAFEASLEAGYKRIRPIVLTTLTTVLGLLPTAYGWGGFDPFLKPMAVAMAYGLLVGSFLTLFATPAIYNFYYPRSCAEGARACADPLENVTDWENDDTDDDDEEEK